MHKIRKVSVIGTGTMGSSIIQIFAEKGFLVKIYDHLDDSINRAITIIRKNIYNDVSEGKRSESEAENIMSLIVRVNSIQEAVTEVDLIIEAIIEKKKEKEVLYHMIDEFACNDVIIASNTSFLNIFELIPESRLHKTLIAHWFSPPHIIPLVEVIKGEETNQMIIDRIVYLLKEIGKIPVVLNRFIPGFCINRIQRSIGREVFYLLDNGIISPEDLDTAVKYSIIPRSLVLGFVQRYDFTGIDLSALNYQNEDYEETPIDNHPKTLFEKVDNNELGIKTGKGFYDYGNKSIEDVLKSRDVKLNKVFELLQEIGTKPVI